jgi:glycine oxidase
MSQNADVVIVGGGVIGCAIAYHLRKAHRSVLVLEQGTIGGQASGAAAGLLAPLGPLPGPGPFADLLLAGFSLFPTLVPELEDASGVRLGYEQTGALRVARQPKSAARLRERWAVWQSFGLQLSWLTGEEARQREPLLAPDVCAAVYAPEESQIQAPQVVQAFSAAATNLGATLRSHTPVIGVLRSGERITGVQTEQEVIACDHLVLATGAWSAVWGEWLEIALPVLPLRGQIAAIQQPIPHLHHIIFGDAIYATPRQAAVIVGATKEEAGFDVQLTFEGVRWLRMTAARLLPILAQSSLETAWAGLRPKTPDNHPILGPLPGWENVSLAIGHNSVGIILSEITGQTIARSVTTGQAPDLIRPFSLERFMKRSAA